MTGIERLRTFARRMDELSVWPGGTKLLDIADQIERERACDADTIENIRLIVGGVIDDMERHVSGHEGADDSHVARWARELRSLRDWRDNAEPVYPMTVLLRRCKEFGVETSDCEDGEDVLNNLIETLRQRLMPEGIEWPRYEDGEPVRIWDKIEDIEVRSIVFNEGGILLSDCTSVPGWGTWRSYKERVRRPAVLAADGEPLEVGQTVYLPGGTSVHVTAIGDMTEGHQTVFGKAGNDITDDEWYAAQLTHERPDTWQRIEDDAGCTATKYNERRGTIFTTKQQVARDLVRRCRALAERERGE